MAAEPKPPVVVAPVTLDPTDEGKTAPPPSADEQARTAVASLSPSPAIDVPADPARIEAKFNLSRDDWRELQQAIAALGFETRGADGKPGPVTRRAVAGWQRARRVEVTGYLGPLQRELILAEARAVGADRAESLEQGVGSQVGTAQPDPRQKNVSTAKPTIAQTNPLIVANIPSSGKVTLEFNNPLNVYNSPSRSRRIGSIVGAVNILAPATNGFVMVDYNGVHAFALQHDIAEKLTKN